MCPFIILTILFTLLMFMTELTAALLHVSFIIHHRNNVSADEDHMMVKLHEGQSTAISVQLSSTNSPEELYGKYRFFVDRPEVADLLEPWPYEFQINSNVTQNGSIWKEYNYQKQISIRANFLGYCKISIEKLRKDSGNLWDTIMSNSPTDHNQHQLIVSVMRDKDLISKVFIYSVVIVVSISYINMGCALDVDSVLQVLQKPIAPAIGLFAQYVCMPLLSYALAMMFFEETYLKLGLFVFGCSPGGGASNMWTVLLNGNLNLSITMTFLSTVMSIALMPFWLFTLGRTIFEGTSTRPPFRNIFSTLATMILFLSIGLSIKRFLPRVAAWARKILAPLSGLMIIFIIIFGTYSNFYMFQVMNWKMLLAAAINVWFGMFFGMALAYLFRKSAQDMLTIAIETGVQNTGVSIVVLGLSLAQPDADLASAVPVASSLMTPIPLLIAWFIVCVRKRSFIENDHKTQHKQPTTPNGNSGHQYMKQPDMSDNEEHHIHNHNHHNHNDGHHNPNHTTHTNHTPYTNNDCDYSSQKMVTTFN